MQCFTEELPKNIIIDTKNIITDGFIVFIQKQFYNQCRKIYIFMSSNVVIYMKRW